MVLFVKENLYIWGNVSYFISHKSPKLIICNDTKNRNTVDKYKQTIDAVLYWHHKMAAVTFNVAEGDYTRQKKTGLDVISTFLLKPLKHKLSF